MIASRTRSRFGRVVSAWPPALRFAAALAAALVVVLATTGLIALVNSDWAFFAPVRIENPGTLYIAAVTLVALLIGVGPALVAAAASMLAVFLVFSRYESFERAVVLVATMLMIIGLAEWQRRAQDAAERAQAKFEAILESMSDAVMVVDAAGRSTDVNHAAIAMLGAADRAAALAKVTHRRADGTPATDEYALLERALAGEETPQQDVSIPDGPNGPRIASAVAGPMRDARGRIIGAVSVSRDMTDRLAQARERESLLGRIERERQFSAHVLANVPVGIAVVRADDFTVLSFNGEYDASVRHAPGSRPLTVGQSLLDALPAASRDAATRLLSRARDEGATIRNSAYAAAVAPDRFYDGTIGPLQLGDGTLALLITAADVTERVRGERERETLLRQVERQAAQLAATFEAMVDGIAVYDAEGNILHRNEAFYRLLHLEPRSAPPLWDAFIREMDMRRADGTPLTREETHSFRALHGETIREEIVLLRDGLGRERSMSQNASPIRAADGAVIGAVVVFNDVTERLERERERERLLTLLEERRQFTQAIFDAVPVCLAVVDTDAMVFSAANPAFIAGTPASYRDLGVGGRSLAAVLPHTAENGFAGQLRHTGRTGERFEASATRYAHPTRGVTYWNETMIPLATRDPAAHHVLYIAADVTKEIEAQQRVAALAREAAERAGQLEAVFAALTEGVIVADLDGKILHSNDAVHRLFGVARGELPSYWELGDRFAFRAPDGTELPEEQRAATRALRGEIATDEPRRFRTAQGEERWMNVSISPVRDAAGAIVGIAMTARDVTERRERAREREALLRLVEERRQFAQAIFDTVPVGLAVINTETLTFSAANPAFRADVRWPYTGRSVNDVPLATVWPDGEGSGIAAQLRAVAAGETRFTHRNRRYAHPTRGETYYDEMAVALPIASDTPTHVLYQTVDVTEQVRAQRRVAAHAREAAERAGQLEAVFGALAEGLILTDARGNIVRANAAVGRILGLDGEPLPPLDTFRERFAVRDPDGVPVSQEQRAAIAALHGATRADQLRRFRDARGEERWMSISTAPVRDEAGAITGVALTMRDVTEERRGIEERERLLREVERRERFAQAIFDSVPVGLMVVGADDGIIRTANDAYAHFIDERFAGADLVGRNAALLRPTGATTPLPENAEEQYLAGLRNIAASGAAVTVREFAYPDYPGRGETFWDLTGVPLFAADGTVADILVVTVDTTEQTVNRRAMEALAKTAAQRAAEQEAIIANMPNGVALYGADGQLIQMNLAGQQISGEAHSPDDPLPAVVEHFDLRYPDGRVIPLDDLPLPRALRGETVSGYEFISHTRHGDRDIVASSAPIRDAAGEITSAVVVFSDITERKRAEGLTTRLGRILDASSNEIYVCDVVSLRFSQVNAGARRNLGYTMDEITHLTPLDIKPEFTAETYRALIAPLRSGEQSEVVFETVHRRKDGSIYPVEVNLQLSQSENPPALVAIIQDITERRAAERQREQLLREIDERRRFVQTVVESAPVGIAAFGVDADLTVRMANGQYLQLLDEPWRGAGIMGHGVREFLPDADAAALVALIRQVIEREEPLVLREFEFNGFARGPGYYDASIVPLRESGARVSGVLTVVADVTERVQSRQRIEELAWDAAQRASELETVIASIADGVLVTDAAGRIILENAASHRLTGRTASGVSLDLAAQVAEYALRVPDGTPLAPDALPLGRAVRGETVAEQVLILRRVDTGEDRFLMCSSAPVRAGSGAITGAVAVFRDITEMKQVEQMKDDFVSIAAHELRTPLTAIKGYAELLERRLSMQKGRESDRRSLDVIRKQSERLSNLVNEMLDVSRIEGGRLELNTEPFDLSALVGEVVGNMRVSSEAHTLSLAAAPGIEVNGDSARIEQVLLNLINNAIIYSPEGGEVDIRVWAEADDALVSVRDQGVGVASDELPHLFDRFYRAPRAGVMRAGGMGLGLYICREIIARHGGTIRAESTPGAGSTFTFSLPLNRKD